MRRRIDFNVGSLAFDASSGELKEGSASRRLEPKAAAVLAALCEAAGSVVSRQELLDRCWSEGAGSDEALTQTVAQVRRALAALGEAPGLVETLSRRGYRLSRIPQLPERQEKALSSDRAEPRSMLRTAAVGAAAAALLLMAWIAFVHGFGGVFDH